MAKFTENVALANPQTKAVTSFAPGDEVPDWATDLVGDHVTDGTSSAPAKRGPGRPRKDDDDKADEKA